MTRTDLRAISLENHTRKKVPYEGRTPSSNRARKSRTAPLEKRTDPRLPCDGLDETTGFDNLQFKMSDSYSEDYSESKEYPATL